MDLIRKERLMNRPPSLSTLLVAAASSLIIAGCETSRTTASQRPTIKETRSDYPDASFLQDAARSSIREVEMSRGALTRSEDPKVKEFAQKMIDDHTRMNQELKSFATSRGVVIPDQANAEDRQQVDKLASLSGKSFDQEFAGRMVADHQKAVEDFRARATSASDPEVRQFASKHLTMLEEHLERARDLQKSLGNG
jgi:putative membrane protein